MKNLKESPVASLVKLGTLVIVLFLAGCSLTHAQAVDTHYGFVMTAGSDYGLPPAGSASCSAAYVAAGGTCLNTNRSVTTTGGDILSSVAPVATLTLSDTQFDDLFYPGPYQYGFIYGPFNYEQLFQGLFYTSLAYSGYYINLDPIDGFQSSYGTNVCDAAAGTAGLSTSKTYWCVVEVDSTASSQNMKISVFNVPPGVGNSYQATYTKVGSTWNTVITPTPPTPTGYYGCYTSFPTATTGSESPSTNCFEAQSSPQSNTPSASLTANPSSIYSGNSSTLTWTSTNASSCVLTAAGGPVSTSGGSIIVSPTSTMEYVLQCTGSTGTTVTRYATVTVTTAPAATATITASQYLVPLGQSTTLTWSSTNATSCAPSSIPHDNNFYTSGATSGSIAVSPTSTTTYGVICSGPGFDNNGSDQIDVFVGPSVLSASCSVSPSSAITNQPVTWTATSTYGTAPYTYTWGGSVTGSNLTESETYPSGGTFNGQITVHSSDGQQVTQACTVGGGGIPSGGASVTVTSCTPTLSANPTTISPGATTTLMWNEPAACDPSNSCTFSDGHSVGLSGNYVVSPPTPPTGNSDIYSVTCPVSIPGNTDQTTVTVNVATSSMSVSPNLVRSGSPSDIIWTSAYAHTCTITKNGLPWQTGTSGNVEDTETTQSIYSMTCDTVPTPTKAIVNVAASTNEI